MQYTVTVEKADYAEYVKFVQRSVGTGMSTSFWKNFVVFMILGIVCVTAINLLGLRTHFHVPTALFILGLFVLLYVFYAAQYRKKMTPLSHGFVLGERTYVINDEGFREVRPNYESFTKWPSIVKLGETPTQVFLMFDNVAGHIFPTKSLSTTESNTLRAFLKSKMANQVL